MNEDPERFAVEAGGTDYGVIKPGWGGRWNWPLSIMEPGDFFHVAHEDKAPGNVRHLVSVRAAQTGKSFSVRKASPMLAGHTLVLCAPPRDQREAMVTSPGVIDAELAQTRLNDAYGYLPLDQINHRAIYEWEHVVVEAKQVAKPVRDRITFNYANFTLGAKLGEHGVRIMRLPNGTTPSQWQTMEHTWDSRRAKWKREQLEASERGEKYEPRASEDGFRLSEVLD